MSAFVAKSGTYRVDPTRQINADNETARMPMGFVRNRGDFMPGPLDCPRSPTRQLIVSPPTILGAVTRIAGEARYRLQRPRHP
jgi:hypothetical protein